MSVETTVNTIVIRLMNNSGTFQETETSAETVGELRNSLGLDGTIVVNNQVAAEDSIQKSLKEIPSLKAGLLCFFLLPIFFFKVA